MTHTLTVTDDELAMLRAALDSHIYWQLSDSKYRYDGYVRDPGSDDADNAAAIMACQTLLQSLDAL